MGRILSPSKPQAAAPQVVYYTPTPAATTSTSSTSSSSSTSGATDDVVQTPEQVEAERAENLLRRNRSRLGTVLTSFRGVLSQNDLSASRKTLLGE